MMHIDKFCQLAIANLEVCEKKIADFKLYWIQQNQISPHKFPICEPTWNAWVELFTLWDEGLITEEWR